MNIALEMLDEGFIPKEVVVYDVNPDVHEFLNNNAIQQQANEVQQVAPIVPQPQVDSNTDNLPGPGEFSNDSDHVDDNESVFTISGFFYANY